MSLESSRWKIRKLRNFQVRSIRLKIPHILGRKQDGTKIPGKKISKKLFMLCEVALLPGNSAKCCFIRDYKAADIQIGVIRRGR